MISCIYCPFCLIAPLLLVAISGISYAKMRVVFTSRPLHCLNQLFHPSTGMDRGPAEAGHKLGNEVGHQSGAAFVRPSALT